MPWEKPIMLKSCLPRRGRIPYYYQCCITDDNYDVKNGWMFQKDRSNINDGFEEGDLSILFDDSQFWENIEKSKIKKKG